MRTDNGEKNCKLKALERTEKAPGLKSTRCAPQKKRVDSIRPYTILMCGPPCIGISSGLNDASWAIGYGFWWALMKDKCSLKDPLLFKATCSYSVHPILLSPTHITQTNSRHSPPKKPSSQVTKPTGKKPETDCESRRNFTLHWARTLQTWLLHVKTSQVWTCVKYVPKQSIP